MLGVGVLNEKNCKISENSIDAISGKIGPGDPWGFILRDFAASNAITASVKQVRDNLRNVRRFLQFSKISLPGLAVEPIEKFLAFLRTQDKSRKTIMNIRGENRENRDSHLFFLPSRK